MIHKQYTFTTEIKVRDYELDVEGIVNNANYLHYLELTRHDFCETAGYTFQQMHEQGYDPVLARAEINYMTPLRMGDTMTSCLNVCRRGPRYFFEQDIFRKSDGAQCIHAIITVVILHDGRPTRGDELQDAFGPYMTTFSIS
ncbi:MAG: acyl-CoA thioesterase [Clostridiales bacterium]|nr:acyl-CoA thioesterase [Clostridiales bacterium]